MKRLITIITIFTTFHTLSFSGNYERKFKEANNLYSQNKFEEALSLYNEIISGGFESADLYYNAGNTSYRLNRVGESIYFYEKALRLAPDDEDCQYNLELAKLRVKNIPSTLPKPVLLRFFEDLIFSVNINFWMYLSIGLFIVSLSVFYSFVKSQVSKTKKIYFSFSMIILFFSLLTIFFTRYQSSELNSNTIAVIIEDEFQAKSSPNGSATKLFPVFEGYKVEIEDTSGDWCEIKLTDGKKAWVKEKILKRL